MRIEDLPNINGANFSGTFRVLSTHKRTAKSGTDFVHAELADTSGSIRAYAWPERYQGPELEERAVVSVAGVVKMLHGNQILDLYQGEAAIIEDPLHLLTAGLCPVIDGVDRFRCVLNGLSTQYLKQFALQVFADDSITLPFLTLPASRNHHHSFPGGLLCHSLECVDLVAGLAITMSQERRELGMVAALLHDIGKVSAHHHKAKTKLVGAILHHDALTLEILAPHLLHLDSISSDSAVALRYLLTWDKTGYSRRPLMVLAEAVAAADRISSGANAEKQAFSESEPWRRLQSWHGSRYWLPNLPEILKGT